MIDLENQKVKKKSKWVNKKEWIRRKKRKQRIVTMSIVALLLIVCVLLILKETVRLKDNASNLLSSQNQMTASNPMLGFDSLDLSSLKLPEYSGQPYTVINNNVPFFSEKDLSTTSFESYSELDALGRCGTACANVGRELMPAQPRGEIGNIIPTGWNQCKYEGLIDTDPPYLYNRCHLIAYCLTAENDNIKNLITGTRYMNVEGMLPFEEKVANYLEQYGNHDNHVMYRATPIFEGKNMLADGVLLEAYSVEDSGRGICFCVFCYNVQPGVKIDYLTGQNIAE